MTDGQTEQLKTAFLDAFRQGGTVIAACEKAGVSRSTVYNWRKIDPDFEVAFLEAEAENTEHLEQVAEELARPHDVETEEYGIVTDRRGNPVIDLETGLPRMLVTKRSKQRKYDTTLLIFLLKGRLPMKYRERFDLAHSGEVGIRLTSIDEALARIGEDAIKEIETAESSENSDGDEFEAERA